MSARWWPSMFDSQVAIHSTSWDIYFHILALEYPAAAVKPKTCLLLQDNTRRWPSMFDSQVAIHSTPWDTFHSTFWCWSTQLRRLNPRPACYSNNNLFRPSSVALDYPVTMICVPSMDNYQKCQSITSIVCGDGLSSHNDLVPYYWIIIDYSVNYRTCVPSLTSQEEISDQEEVLTKWHLWDFGLCWCVEVVHILVNLK